VMHYCFCVWFKKGVSVESGAPFFYVYLYFINPFNFLDMEKFLSIPVTNEQTQLLSATGIVLIEQESTTTVHVHYKASTGTDVVTITHATAPAGNETMRDAIQNAIIGALQTSWTHVAYEVNNLPFAVSGIAIA
jgi:hypothetical protein